jgi:hypothetical protein
VQDLYDRFDLLRDDMNRGSNVFLNLVVLYRLLNRSSLMSKVCVSGRKSVGVGCRCRSQIVN